MSKQENVSEHNSEHLQITLRRLPGCQVELEVTAAPEMVQKCHKDALKAVKKQVSIPGFRKGKAPEKMILEQYGAAVQKEWGDIIANQALIESFKVTETFPFGRNGVKNSKVKTLDKDSGAELEYTFEAEPSVPKIEMDKLTLEEVKPEPVTDEKMNDEIKQLLFRFGDWKEAEGRAVQEGDKVHLDIEYLLQEGEENTEKDRIFIVRESSMPEWMFKMLIGAEAGKAIEGGDPEMENPNQYRVTVTKIEELSATELTEDICKRAGGGSPEEMRDKLKQKLELQAKGEAQFKRRKQLADKVLELYDFDVPRSMFDGERAARLRNMIEAAINNQGMTEEQVKEISTELETEADRLSGLNQRLFFLLRELFGGDINIANEDVSNECTRQMLMVPLEERTINPQQSQDELYLRAFVQLFIERALDRLLETQASQNA